MQQKKEKKAGENDTEVGFELGPRVLQPFLQHAPLALLAQCVVKHFSV